MLEEATIACPYCGEALTIGVEPETRGQRYIEDCQVCCQPMVIDVGDAPAERGAPEVTARRDDE